MSVSIMARAMRYSCIGPSRRRLGVWLVCISAARSSEMCLTATTTALGDESAGQLAAVGVVSYSHSSTSP